MMAGFKRIGIALALLVAAGVIIYFGHRWYGRSQVVQTTDDAYVRGEITAISSRVSGYAVEVLVDDNFPVKATQTLVRIDPREFRMYLNN